LDLNFIQYDVHTAAWDLREELLVSRCLRCCLSNQLYTSQVI
jgi:hypothetical protein